MSSANTQRDNREALTAFSQQNEYQKSIAIWRDGERKFVAWVTRLIRKLRRKQQTASVELELFRDQFEYETNLDSREEGKKAFEGACRAHIHRAAAHQAQRVENEQKAGGIADFDDLEPMGDLGGDPDFEAALIKVNPELKRYKR